MGNPRFNTLRRVARDLGRPGAVETIDLEDNQMFSLLINRGELSAHIFTFADSESFTAVVTVGDEPALTISDTSSGAFHLTTAVMAIINSVEVEA